MCNTKEWFGIDIETGRLEREEKNKIDKKNLPRRSEEDETLVINFPLKHIDSLHCASRQILRPKYSLSLTSEQWGLNS